MPQRPSPHPTAAALEVLSILWRRGPGAVRAVPDLLLTRRQTSLTTTLKTLQVMTRKALLLGSDERPHRYTTASPERCSSAESLPHLARRAAADRRPASSLARGVPAAGRTSDLRSHAPRPLGLASPQRPRSGLAALALLVALLVTAGIWTNAHAQSATAPAADASAATARRPAAGNPVVLRGACWTRMENRSRMPPSGPGRWRSARTSSGPNANSSAHAPTRKDGLRSPFRLPACGGSSEPRRGGTRMRHANSSWIRTSRWTSAFRLTR